MEKNAPAEPTARRRLPTRRPNQTCDLAWAGATYAITLGFHLDGTVAEVFCDGAKIGSEMQALLADACVLASLGLQHGIAPSELAHSMARTPADGNKTRPASVIGAVVEVLTEGPVAPAVDIEMDAADAAPQQAL